MLLPPAAVIAEEGGEQLHVLEDVVVTSTNKSRAMDTPASISVITAEDLEKIGAKNIIEGLERIPGVFNTTTSNTSISIRGTRSSMAGGPVILIDGVAQNLGLYRREELDLIPVSQVLKIEVLRSAGIAYGPGAGRGVINIITKKGKTQKPFNAEGSASYGSWTTHNESLNLSGGIGQWDYYGNISHYDTDGYKDDEQTRTGILLKAGYRLSDHTRIGVRGNWIQNDQDRAYGLNMYDWQLENFRRDLHFPRSQTDPSLVWHQTQEQDTAIYAFEFSREDAKSFVDGNFAFTNFEEDYWDTKDIFYSNSTARGDLQEFEQDTYTLNLSGGYNFTFDDLIYSPSIGVTYEKIEYKQRVTYPYDFAGTRSTAANDLDIDNEQYGFFLDNDLRWQKKWGLKIGGRVDNVDFDYTDQQAPPLTVKKDDTLWSWSVAPSYHFSESGNIYFMVGRNYWYPTPKYFAWAADYASPNNRPEDLKAEETLTYELGYKHLLHRAFNVNADVYFMDQNDKFASFYEGGNFKGIKNLGTAETIGVEVEIDGRPIDWFGYRASGTYMEAEWTEGQAKARAHPSNASVIVDLDGKQVYGIPNYTYQIGADFYPLSGLRISVDATTFGDYYLDYLNRLKYPSKTTVDARIVYDWKNWQFWVLGKNIFDRDIERAINSDGELTGPNGTPETSYYPQPGIYLEAGLKFRY